MTSEFLTWKPESFEAGHESDKVQRAAGYVRPKDLTNVPAANTRRLTVQVNGDQLADSFGSV